MSTQPQHAQMEQGQAPAGQTLLIDADDTLWENYIRFEQAIADFITFLDHKSHTREQVREVLNDCEACNIAAMGYGLASFERSLADCFARLSQVELTASQRASIAGFAHGIATQPVELLPGVAETLLHLQSRHELILVTKGHPLEQMDKFRRSGLQHLFAKVEILDEKSPDAYRRLTELHGWQPECCWMIGNSPKSDIWAALEAGLNAVHVPHEHTWVLELCQVPTPEPPQRLLKIDRFAELQSIF